MHSEVGLSVPIFSFPLVLVEIVTGYSIIRVSQVKTLGATECSYEERKPSHDYNS